MRIIVIIALFLICGGIVRAAAAAGIPNFKTQEIDKSLKIGYAVSLVDINGDGKLDIVVVDKDRLIWFENPTWKLRTIMEGQKNLDNVKPFERKEEDLCEDCKKNGCHDHPDDECQVPENQLTPPPQQNPVQPQ